MSKDYSGQAARGGNRVAENTKVRYHVFIMPLEVKKKEGESVGSFLYRFNKKVRQSGVVKEVKKRRFRSRAKNKQKRRLGALYRLRKQEEFSRARKLGYR